MKKIILFVALAISLYFGYMSVTSAMESNYQYIATNISASKACSLSDAKYDQTVYLDTNSELVGTSFIKSYGKVIFLTVQYQSMTTNNPKLKVYSYNCKKRKTELIGNLTKQHKAHVLPDFTNAHLSGGDGNTLFIDFTRSSNTCGSQCADIASFQMELNLKKKINTIYKKTQKGGFEKISEVKLQK